jgi:hypothetical protein
MLATGPALEKAEGNLAFFPILAQDRGTAAPVWTSANIACEHHPIGPTAASIGPGWPVAVKHIDTSAWLPGIYTADFKSIPSGFSDTDVLQIIVRNPKPGGRVLLKLGTNTYQAYNQWGGHSLYATSPSSNIPGGAIVSFDRPSLPVMLEYDIYLIGFLEAYARERGFAIDYACDFDVHSNPALIESYKLLATSAHDEYWSKETFDAVEDRIRRQGRNTIFYGANTAYWEVRFTDVNRPQEGGELGRQIVCYKSEDDPIVLRSSQPDLFMTARYRDGARRPENMITGVAYQNWFQPYDSSGQPRPSYSYETCTVDGPLFEGTGWRVGDQIGSVVGYEWDNRDPEGDGRRLFDPARSHGFQLPLSSLQVLFRGQPTDVDGKKGLAEAVLFQSEAGARVFSTGTIRWAWGLGKPQVQTPSFRRFNLNMLDMMLTE